MFVALGIIVVAFVAYYVGYNNGIDRVALNVKFVAQALEKCNTDQTDDEFVASFREFLNVAGPAPKMKED